MTVAEGLPEVCWVPNEKQNRSVLVRRGHKGFFPTPHVIPLEAFEMLNSLMGITEAQRKAMMAGSMHGWCEADADPKKWENA